MKKAGNCFILIAIVFLIQLFFWGKLESIIMHPNDLVISSLDDILFVKKCILFTILIQIVSFFCAGYFLKNDNTVIRKANF